MVTPAQRIHFNNAQFSGAAHQSRIQVELTREQALERLKSESGEVKAMALEVLGFAG